MDLQHLLARNFRYDLWANRIWLNHLGIFHVGSRHLEIAEHMLWAHQIWLQRIGFPVEPQHEDTALLQLFQQTHDQWLRIIDEVPLSSAVIYQSSDGNEHTNTVADISLHVANHGTYHRGQLRELAETQGILDFPETDFIFYLRE